MHRNVELKDSKESLRQEASSRKRNLTIVQEKIETPERCASTLMLERCCATIKKRILLIFIEIR